MVINGINSSKDDTVIKRNTSKETNKRISKIDTQIKLRQKKAWPKGTYLVTGDFTLENIDQTQTSRKFRKGLIFF